MKKFLFACCLCLIFVSSDIPATATGQQKKPRKSAKAPEPTSLLVGKPVRVVRADGLEVSGKLVSLDMQKIVYENPGGEKLPIPMDIVAAIHIGDPPKPQIDTQFVADAENAVGALIRISDAVAGENDKGLTYREYQQKVVEAKIAVETFIGKHASLTEQQTLFADLRKIVAGYDMVSPVWALRVGVDQRRSVTEDAPEMKPILGAFPDLKTSEYNRDGLYPTDRVIAWVWSKNTVQIRAVQSRIRTLGEARNTD